MVTKNQIKLVKSLQQKKYRIQHKMFVAEGKKLVGELLSAGMEPVALYETENGIMGNTHFQISSAAASDMKKMSGLKTPSRVLGVFKIPQTKPMDTSDWVLVLDAVRDPGNLGTIIRLCDWYGIAHLVCSNDTVDVYNPKVLQATMGSVARVNVIYEDLEHFLAATKLPVYGAFMDGENVYREKFPKKGMLVMGSEASGISNGIEKLVDKKISIPQYGEKSAESLNVATATAVLLNEIRRDG
ncbi:MAG: RNA methyltransferase [Muricauda sp.]|nr:RNA methyltransferase [Allomuricauda sp.]MAU26298.1 RNA methyltransferase [Allomuricauda sp.]MBC32100.1 RNA methyltransferase [Allomuricauda sp.]|tara:strand:- start:3165 stop:3890 length:726 start_codon:yes stop_codon:yes gene_type:complete